MMFINRSKASQKKKVLFNLILPAPRASTLGKLLPSLFPGGSFLTLNSGTLLTHFFLPGIPSFLTISHLNAPIPSDWAWTHHPLKAFRDSSRVSSSLLLWMRTTPRGESVTSSNGCDSLRCCVEKDSETISRIMRKECRKELEMSGRGCKKLVLWATWHPVLMLPC